MVFCNTCGTLKDAKTGRCFNCERKNDPLFKAGYYKEQIEKEITTNHPQARWPRCPKCNGIMHPKNSLGLCYDCFQKEREEIGL
jgi:hypothetical protein